MADKKEILFLLLKDKDNFSEPWKDYIVKNDGKPLQEDIYDTLIKELMAYFEDTLSTANMPAKDADMLYEKGILPEAFIQEIVNKMAQIYAYQILLNKRIGRFFYNPEYPDNYLLHHVKIELITRSNSFWIIEKFFETHANDYKKKVFECFTKLEEYNLLVDDRPKPVSCLATTIFNKYKKNNRPDNFDGSYEKRDQITCLFEKYGDVAKVLVGPASSSKFPNLSKFPEDIDNKNILYIIAITFAMDMDDFLNLKQIASEHYRDTSKFEENKFDNRDAMIIAIIRNIKDWYWQTIHELASELWKTHGDNAEKNINYFRNIVYENAKTSLDGKKKVVLGVLTRVDKMIDENGFCKENYDKLLLHNFLIKSNAYCPYINEKKYYKKVFKNWQKKCGDKTRIFDDFYQKIDVWAKDIKTVPPHGNCKPRN